jgi:ATP-dependent Clp protease, protease subunit
MERQQIETYMELMDLPTFNEYSYWEHLQQRKIIINEEVSPDMIERVVMQIVKFNDEDTKNKIPVEKRQPIKLYIFSTGGDVLSGLAVIDAIKKSRTPVYGYNMGLCASMAALIFIVCHKRFALQNSTILLHDGSLAVSSTSKKAKQTMDYYDKLDARLKNIVLQHSKITEELYKEKENDEWYLFSDTDGIELGLVDKIL